MSAMTEVAAGELGPEHIGMRTDGLPGIGGWEPHLVIRDIEREPTGIYIGLRWNDDPDPANTQRGKFAVGLTVPVETRLHIAPEDDKP